jgi:hypothetical protein
MALKKIKLSYALRRVPHFVRRKGWFGCACGVLRYKSFQDAAVKH